MSRTPVPSLSLLRTFLKPSSPSCATCQIRSTHSFMPKTHYAAVTRLDKLHRQEKEAAKLNKIASCARAEELAKEVEAAGQAGTAHNLPFHLGRTKTNNLAIYEHVKSGGSKHITQIQKLSGDLPLLQKSLLEVLKLPEILVDGKGRKKATVAINPLNNHIIVKGWRGQEITRWAQALGF